MNSMLLKRLQYIETLAKGSRWQRLWHNPSRYLPVLLHQKLIYPFTKREWRTIATTFFDVNMMVALPSASELVLLGAKVHDSELRLTRFMLQYLKPDNIVADIGAHFGFYTLLAAYLVGDRGKVLAFEASPKVFEVLEENVRAFPQIEAKHNAVSDATGMISFYEFPTYYSEYNTLSPQQFEQSDWFHKIPHQRVEVPAICLDDFLIEKSVAPDFIKIDVEGAEYQVIKGIAQFLQNDAPIIAMEFLAMKRGNEAHQQALDMLRSLGYRSFYIDSTGNLQDCKDVEAYLVAQGLDSDNLVFVK
ncbi:MAG: FkbM family methyltransferase [Saprospiraceae bacterium]|nr:FkbM family methyltransferase [Saprospiraceae bacterium]